MNEFVDRHLTTIVTGILGFLAWANERRRRRAEIQKVEIDALKTMQETYKTFVSDMTKKYEEVRAELESVREELSKYKQENVELKKEIESILSGVNLTPSGRRR